MNKLLVVALSLLILGGCASPSKYQKQLSPDLQNKLSSIKLKGLLKYENEKFELGDYVYTQSSIPRKNLYESAWVFDGQTLFPYSHFTSRFKCDGDCEEYAESKSPFIHLNAQESTYGNTYEQRIKKSGATALNVVTTASITAASFYILAPLAVPFAAYNLATKGRVYNKLWVEFDHDHFFNAVQSSIVDKHGSIENYINYMDDIAKLNNKIISLSQVEYKALKKIKNDKESEIDSWVVGLKLDFNLTKEYEVKLPAYGVIKDIEKNLITELNSHYSEEKKLLLIESKNTLLAARNTYLKNQKSDFSNASNIYSLKSFINRYENNDLANLIPKAKTKLVQLKNSRHKLAVAKQKNEFNQAKGIVELNHFISTYKHLGDYAGLLPEAKEKLKKATAQQQRSILSKAKTKTQLESFIKKYKGSMYANNSLLLKAENKLSKIYKAEIDNYITLVSNYRANLQEGMDSHCGLITDVKNNIVQVQTMEGLMFIKKAQIYPSSKANCRFYNGVYQPPTGLPI